MVMQQHLGPQQKRQHCGMQMGRPMMTGAMNSKALEAQVQTCEMEMIRMKVQNSDQKDPAERWRDP